MKNKKITKRTKKIKSKNKIKYEVELNTNVFKKKKNCWVAIILKESKDASLLYIPNKLTRFSYEGNVYFNSAQGKYINFNNVVCVYLEGVLLPVDHSYIQYETAYTLYLDNNGQPVKNLEGITKKEISDLYTDEKGNIVYTDDGFLVSDVSDKIKGLEFDSKTSDVLFESNLTERMAMDKGEKVLPLLTVLMFILLIIQIIGLGLTYFMGQ